MHTEKDHTLIDANQNYPDTTLGSHASTSGLNLTVKPRLEMAIQFQPLTWMTDGDMAESQRNRKSLLEQFL